MAGDLYWSNVSLLLKANGTGGSASFVDSSPNALTCTGQSGAVLSATGAKFDGMSIALGATGWVSMPASALLTLSGDFTVEFFSSGALVAGCSITDTGNTAYLYNSTLSMPGGSIAGLGLDNNIGTWKHIAIARSGTTVRVFQDGVLKGTGTNASSFDFSGGKLGQYNGNLYTQGGIDELRITKGVARYTAAFTAPTAGFDVGPLAATATFDLTAPSPTLEAAGWGHADVALTTPSPTLFSASGARAPLLTAPSPWFSATAHNSYGEQAAFLTAPSPTLSVTTGANAKATAPRPTLTAAGTVTLMATATLTAPKPTLDATGKVSGMATATLSAPSPNLVGYSGAVCSVTLTGKATLQATGTTGGIASIAVTAPLFELTATATMQNYGSANLLAPSPKLGGQAQAWLMPPMAKLTAIGTAVVTATYEAYAVNLKHSDPNANDEATHYTNFPFTHVVRYMNSYYGANSTGLYLLEGTTDDGTAIPWAVKTAMDDFKTPLKKTVAAAYFGGRFGPASTVQLHAGEDTPNTYSFTTPRDALAQNHRQVFGKGVKERYYALGASGTGVCELDTIELETHNMSRRV